MNFPYFKKYSIYNDAETYTAASVNYQIAITMQLTKKGDQYKDRTGNRYEVTAVQGGDGLPGPVIVYLELVQPVRLQLSTVQKDIALPYDRLLVRFQSVKPR